MITDTQTTTAQQLKSFADCTAEPEVTKNRSLDPTKQDLPPGISRLGDSIPGVIADIAARCKKHEEQPNDT